MNQELIQKLEYSYVGQSEVSSLPLPLKNSIQLISCFFANNSNNKLCLVFPSKEHAAQWLAIPIVLELIRKDYSNYFSELYNSHKKYKAGDFLILNNKAVVQWVNSSGNMITFKYRPYNNTDTISIHKYNITKLQPAPPNRIALSSYRRVKNALFTESQAPIDKLLNINTSGNRLFMNSCACLVTKYKSFNISIDDILISQDRLENYFSIAKINDNGQTDTSSPLLLTNNLSNLALYSTTNSINKIIIDGISAIEERPTDFVDIDLKGIPTILITDLSEIKSFDFIRNYGFEYFNFTKDTLYLENYSNNSPFKVFYEKIKKYKTFNIIKEICRNTELETIVKNIHSIEKDESNNDLIVLKTSLIQLTNHVSRIAHLPTREDISILISKINNIEALFHRYRVWLGDSHKPIEESISLLKSFVDKLTTQSSEKSTRLKSLLSTKKYDYIICCTGDEAMALEKSFPANGQKPRIISISEVNDGMLSSEPKMAILTGWAKSITINRILSSFIFSELTVLFYQHENNYYNSLQRRNRENINKIRATVNNNGIRSVADTSRSMSYDELFHSDEISETISEKSFDIMEFELKNDNEQYSKYTAKGNLIDSLKAKRIDFENDSFIYASESHKLLVFNNFHKDYEINTRYSRKRVEALKIGDVIALISTDRDILAELVETNTTHEDFAAVKQWTDLWKNLLKEHFLLLGNDFDKLLEELREHGCQKHEATIKIWLQDENRIGPDDDSDLISIALLTNSDILNDNIATVRAAIRKMTGWRMKAADAIIKIIKSKIHDYADSSIVNSTIILEDLGSLTVLRITDISKKWEYIDRRYINRLLQKDII